MSLSQTVQYSSDLENLEWISVSLDGTDLTCGFREGAWCYDPDTYRAWEAARDRALAPPDDPLERYLRQQGDPPLWYDEPPFERIGDTTTGVFRMEPYVEYEFSGELFGEEDRYSPHGPVTFWLQCVPVDRNGAVVISDDTLSRTFIRGSRYSTRQAHLCEFDVGIGSWWDGVVSISFAPAEDQ